MHNDEVLRLAALGYHLVPWANRHSSTPHPLVKGWLLATYSKDTIAKFTTQFPEADWAAVPRETVVLDLENKNGLDGQADLARLCANQGVSVSDLTAQCAITRTKSDGRHIWFRAPENCTLRGGQHIEAGLEVKRLTGSCHVPPSMGYEWIRPLGPISELPILPDWLVELWQKAKAEANTISARTTLFANGSRNLALCAFAAEARRTLGLDKNELRSLLLDIRRTRCEDPASFSEEECFKIADHYASRDVDNVGILALNGDALSQSVLRFVARMPAPQTVAAEPKEEVREAVVYPTLAPEDIQPTPLLADMVGWQLDNSPSPQPELSLLSTLIAISTAMGRTWSMNGKTANIYGMGLAPTGAGKEAPKDMLEKLATAAGFGNVIVGNVASGAGFLTHMQTVPELLWCEDEFGYKMESLSRKDSAVYMQDLIAKALTAYAGGDLQPKVEKSGATEVIHNPYVNIYGASQVGFFWQNCSTKFIQTGFINRCTLVMGRAGKTGAEDLEASEDFINKVNSDDYDASSLEVPDEFAKLLGGIRGHKTVLAKLVGDRSSHRMPMSDDVKKYSALLWHKAKERNRTKHDGASAAYAIAMRDGEKIFRMALLHAWSLSPDNPRMTKESLDWADRFVQYSTDLAIVGYESRMQLIMSQDDEVDAVYNKIAMAGRNGISQTDLANAMRRLHKVLDKIIESLVKGERIAFRMVASKGCKPKRMWYSTEHIAQTLETIP